MNEMNENPAISYTFLVFLIYVERLLFYIILCKDSETHCGVIFIDFVLKKKEDQKMCLPTQKRTHDGGLVNVH